MANDVRTTLVTTVDSINHKYSVGHYSSAEKACIVQNIIERPITEDLIRKFEGNMILNCNFTKQDIICADYIFRPFIVSL